MVVERLGEEVVTGSETICVKIRDENTLVTSYFKGY